MGKNEEPPAPGAPQLPTTRWISQDALSRAVVASGPRVQVDLGEGRDRLDGVAEATALDFAQIATTLGCGPAPARIVAAVVEVVGRLVHEQADGWYPIAIRSVFEGEGDLERLIRESFAIRLLSKRRADLWPATTLPPEIPQKNAERGFAQEFLRQGCVAVRLPFALTHAWEELVARMPRKLRKDQVVMQRAAFTLAEIHRMRLGRLRVFCFRPRLENKEVLGNLYDEARFHELLRRTILAVQHGTLTQDHAFRPIRLDPSPNLFDGASDGAVRSLVHDHAR